MNSGSSDRKDEAIEKIRIVEGILRRWDPSGVKPGRFAPADEYDSYAPHIVSMVESGCTADDLVAHLEHLSVNTIGVGSNLTASAKFAAEIFRTLKPRPSTTPISFEAALRGHFAAIEGLGYAYGGIAPAFTKALGNYWEARYESKERARRITVSRFPGDSARAAFVTVSVSNTAIDDATGIIFVEEYARFVGASEAVMKSLDYGHYPPDSAVDQFLTATARYLLSELRDVVTGLEWTEVPFDWSPYK